MHDPAPTEPLATPADSVRLADERLHQGEPILAYNAAQSGLMRWPGHVRLRQLQALALARSGDVERANLLLAQLADEGQGDAETLGMLARTHKDLALAANVTTTRSARHLDAGFRLYRARIRRCARPPRRRCRRVLRGHQCRDDGGAQAASWNARAASRRECARICERASPDDASASSRTGRKPRSARRR